MNKPSPALPGSPGIDVTAGTPHELQVRFVGSGSEYFRIWIVNLLLTLVTLGLYYPFAKARRLRYFHGATEVGGSPLSFHADPWKMLRGYGLVALLLGLYAVAGHFSATAGVVAFVIVAAVWPALWHSSMRFRLANTGWRGLRLRYTGSMAGAYAAMAVPTLASVAIVLGSLMVDLPSPDAGQPPAEPSGPGLRDGLLVGGPLLLALVLMPWFFWRIKCLQHTNFMLGQERTRFSCAVGPFYGLALRTLGLGLLIGLCFVIVIGAAVLLGEAYKGATLGPVVSTILAMLAYVGMLAVAAGYWTAGLQNLAWGRTATAHLRFSSTLGPMELAALWFRNGLLVVLTLGLYFPFAQVASARLRVQAVTVVSSVDPDTFADLAARADEAAAGDAAGDLLGFDIGL